MGVIVGLVHLTFLATLYVGSLYLFKGALAKSRNDVEQIRRRTIAVMIACICSIVYAFFFSTSSSSNNKQYSFLSQMGLHSNIFKHVLAVFVSLLLNTILFTGPILHYLMESQLLTYEAPFTFNIVGGVERMKQMVTSQIDPIMKFIVKYPKFMITGEIPANEQEAFQNFRTYVIGPVSEEIVFRACMYTVSHFSGSMTPKQTIIWSSVVFGVAHCHHVVEHILHGRMSVQQAIANVLIQFTYTTVFAAYNGYLFIRTGSILASIILHAYCNYLELPDFAGMITHKHKTLFIPLLVSGLCLFVVGAAPFTNQYVFNSIYYQ